MMLNTLLRQGAVMCYERNSKMHIFPFIRIVRRFRHVTLLLMVCVTAFALTGCEPGEPTAETDLELTELGPLTTNSTPTQQIVDATTGKPMQQVAPGVPAMTSLAGATGARSEFAPRGWSHLNQPRGTGTRGADADYVDKADVYWKLNWMRKQLLSGKVPAT